MEYKVNSFTVPKQSPPFINELRIGNWIASYGVLATDKEISNEEIQKVKIDGNLFKFLIDNPFATYKGIPLSPDILEKCGKKCGPNNHNWEYEIKAGALKWYFRWNTEWYSEIGNIYIDASVQYLHEVQNLYFALIRRELIVNL